MTGIIKTETWELVPCHREPVVGEIRYLRSTVPSPIPELDGGLPWPFFYPAIWDGKDWLVHPEDRAARSTFPCDWCGAPVPSISSSSTCDSCGRLWTKAYQAGREFEREYGDD